MISYKIKIKFIKKGIFEGRKIEIFNNLVDKVKIPHIFSRKFPKLGQKVKIKSSELNLFLFHLSLPVLIDILPADYWYLLCMYVFSIRTLYEPIYSIIDIRNAEAMFKCYFDLVGRYFNKFVYTYTLHAHLHLFDQVKLHGPLQSHSQFVFEV